MRAYSALLLTLILFVFNAHSQYCTSGGPSQTADSNVESVSLAGDAGAINWTGCPGVSGVQEVLGQSTTLTANGSYSAFVQFGTCNGNYTGAGEAWIDFNGDQTFQANESIGTWQGLPPQPMSTFNFTVPGNCYNGTVRMRVIQQEGGSVNPPLNPCGSFTWGSVTDFTIVLQGGVPTYCTNGGPSQTADSNVESVVLVGEGSSINWTGCPGVAGVQEVLGQSVTLSAGNSYTANIQFGTCGGNFNGAGQAWIDYNQNATFEASESIGSWQGSIPTALSAFNFTVPAGAVQGQTRMRVIQQEATSLPINPCANFTWGSVTDFTVEIGEAVDCGTYNGDNVLDPIIVGSLPYTHNHSNNVCYTDQHNLYVSPDVYYLVTVDPANPVINVSLCGSSFDTHITAEEFNGMYIAGNDDGPTCAPQSEITFNASAYSTVYIIVEGWGNEKGDYTLNINSEPVGLNDVETPLFRLHPNPTDGVVNIESVADGTIDLRSTNGELLRQYNFDKSLQIDLSEFPSGLYFIQLRTENKSATKKIIVK